MPLTLVAKPLSSKRGQRGEGTRVTVVTEATRVRFALSTTLTIIVAPTSITGVTTTVTSVAESDTAARSITETKTKSVPVAAAKIVNAPESVPGTDLTTRINLTVRLRRVETRIVVRTVRKTLRPLQP